MPSWEFVTKPTSEPPKFRRADPLHKKLTGLAASSDQIRSKIVATKEGGAITGEERLREYVTKCTAT